jgi:hypothetical protein
MKIYYVHPSESNFVTVIVSVDGLAWDFEEGLCGVEFYDTPADREADLIAMIKRWQDVGTLEDIFRETDDEYKYPASEILTRFPDAKELK